MSNVRGIRTGGDTVVIRLATPADTDGLRRLAALDSARAPLGAVLVAERDGHLRAAYSLDERRAIADPFAPTADLVALLRTRAELLTDARTRPARRLGRPRALPARS